MDKRLYEDSLFNRLLDIGLYIFMAFILIVTLFPFINQIAISLSDSTTATKGGIYLFPKNLTFDAYKFVFSNDKFLKVGIISFLRIVVGTITGVIATSLLAYLVVNERFSGRKLLRRLFVVTMFFSGGLIPTYLLFIKLGFINTFSVYWVPTLFVPYYMLMIAAYMQKIPKSLIESARIDGASELRIYWSIILPLCIPVLSAIAIFIAVFHWNDWFTVSIYNPEGTWDTLQVYLKRILLESEMIEQLQNQTAAANATNNLTPVTVRAATTVIVTLPIALVYPFFQKYFISGITVGAVKE